SQATDSASRWLVGSSSSSMSGGAGGRPDTAPRRRPAATALAPSLSPRPRPPPLPARDLGHVHVARRHPERVHRELDSAVEIPGVGGVDAILYTRLVGQEIL